MKSVFQFIIIVSILQAAWPVFGSAIAGSCEDLFRVEFRDSNRYKISDQENTFISAQELAADVTEAIISNPNGFQHRDAEKAIINNLGDLSAEASYYLEQSNLWTNSTAMQISLDDLQSGLKDFNDSAKRLQKLTRNRIFKNVFGNERRRQRRIADLVESIRACRHEVKVCKVDLNRTMDDFESLMVRFGDHIKKMYASIEVVKGAIEIIKGNPRLTEDEKTPGVYQLGRYLNNVTTSIATSKTSLSMLSMQFTNTDLTIRKTENQLTAVVDTLATKGISTELFKQPFFVKESLETNPHIGLDIRQLFYSGKSSEETLQDLNTITKTARPFTIEEVLVILKLLPRGGKFRISWHTMLSQMGHRYGTWNDKEERSADIPILAAILSRMQIKSPAELTIEKSNFGRLRDYVEDILESSVSLNRDGLNGKFRDDVRRYILDLTEKLNTLYDFAPVREDKSE